jgi:hypothetical protein
VLSGHLQPFSEILLGPWNPTANLKNQLSDKTLAIKYLYLQVLTGVLVMNKHYIEIYVYHCICIYNSPQLYMVLLLLNDT